MNKILVTYATNSGSTAEVAQVIAEELGKNSAKVEVRQIDEATTIEEFVSQIIPWLLLAIYSVWLILRTQKLAKKKPSPVHIEG